MRSSLPLLPLVDLEVLVTLVVLAVGLSFVITGSTIGKPLRVLAHVLVGRVGLGHIRLDSLARCPYCNAWWGAFILGFISGLPWWQCLESAFGACGVAAIVQAQWSLAANERFDHAETETGGEDADEPSEEPR